jgi:RNA polymerase sigma-70 factor (ECF subfamily)
VHIDWGSVESAFAADLADDAQPDRVYARAWAITLLDEALDLVEKHYEKTARPALFTALLPALESPLAERTYEDVAARLGMTGAAVRQAAVRLRERYRRALLELAALRLGITCEAQLHEEIRSLLGV